MKLVTFYVVFLAIRISSSHEVLYETSDYTKQSRTLVSQTSNLAIDGSRHTCSISAGVNKTEHAWWRVVIRRPYFIYKIMIFYKPNDVIAPDFKRYLKGYVSANEADPEDNACMMQDKSNKQSFVTLLCDKPVSGRFITIKKYGNSFHPLMLCEVKLFAQGLATVSTGQSATSNMIGQYDFGSKIPGQAVDGNNHTCARIKTERGQRAWWGVRLEDFYSIHGIIIDFNQNSSVTDEQIYITITVVESLSIYERHFCVDVGQEPINRSVSYIDVLCVNPNPIGKYVFIDKYKGTHADAMLLCEVTVIANLTNTDKLPDDENQRTNLCKNDEIRCDVFSKFFCIPNTKLCNKVKDCPNGIDELNCTCQKNDFKCIHGQCIPKEWLCDGLRDCQLGEDEEQNCAAHCKREDDFVCERTKQCIDRVKRCNGYMECSDHSDEQGCFEMVVQGVAEEKYLLLATYHGKHNYYVCADNWNQQMSYDMCLYLTGRTLGSYYKYKPEWIKEKLVIISREKNPFEKSIPSMANFRETNNCTALVEIVCQWKPSEDSRYQCGTRAIPDKELGPYIINGDAAKLGAWPWQVQILAQGNQMCGGSILNERWILTAAHCSRNMDESDLIVKVGTNKFDDPDVEGIGVSLIVNHPSYEGVKNDIGLLRLSKQIKFSKTVTPICLPKKKYELNNLKNFRYCVMAGFGRIDRAHSHPLYLMQGRMNLMPDDVCVKNLATIGEDTEQGYMKALKENYLLCAGSVPTRYGINPCWGDSGGPLVCKDGFGIWYQVAMVELFEIGRYKEECTNSLLTKVDYHLDFISKALQSDMAKVFQTYIGISSYLIISLKYLSVSQNVFLCQ